MSKANSFETDILELIFLNTDLTNVGDAAGLLGSAAAGNLYLSLHTGDPGEAGDQATNECAYTSYARVAVGRSGSNWTVTGNTVDNDNQVAWPQATGGSETATYFGIGVSSSGSTGLLYSGALTSSLAISNGITPTGAAGALTVSED